MSTNGTAPDALLQSGNVLPVAPVAPLKEVGSTGLKAWGGIVREDSNPEFSGVRWLNTLRRMSEGDPVVGAMLLAVKLFIRQAERTIEPRRKKASARRAATFVQECFDDLDLSFDITLGEILDMLIPGWSFFELCYKERRGPRPRRRTIGGVTSFPPSSKYNDGKIGWQKFAVRAQETLYRWVFDEHGGVQAFEQLAPPTYQLVQIPIEKALLFNPETRKNNPEGQTPLKNAWRPWYMKRQLEQIEAIGVERDLNGYPLGWAPAEWFRDDATDDEKAALQLFVDFVTNVRRDQSEGAVLPKAVDPTTKENLMDFSLITSGGRRSFDTEAIIARYDQRIALTMMADFLLIGHERVGSYALSATKSDLFTKALDTWAAAVAEVFNRFAIPRLCDLNNIAPADYPTLHFGNVREVSLQVLGQFLAQAKSAGMPLFPSRSTEDALYRLAGLPVPPENDRPDATTTTAPADSTTPPPMPDGPGTPDQAPEEQNATGDQNVAPAPADRGA